MLSPINPEALTTLKALLANRPELSHLSVRQRGRALTLFSQPAGEPEPIPHVRFNLVAGGQWTLAFPRHTGRWEKTPFVDNLEVLFTTLVDQFGFLLAPQ